MALPREDGRGFGGVGWEPRMGSGPNATAQTTAATPPPPRCSHTTEKPPCRKVKTR